MPGRLIAAATLLAIAGACSTGGSSAPPRPPSPSVETPAPPAPAPPARAVLADAGGLPVIGVRDHMPAVEYAAGASDQVLSLAEVESWGWADASLRRWAGGGRSAEVVVLETDRSDGARLAFAAWAAQAAAAPFAGADCPAQIAGLDECRLGSAGQRTLIVGRLDVDVFRLDVIGLDGPALAAAQAQRLRAT